MFFDNFFFANLTVFWSFFNFESILVQKLNSFLKNKVRVLDTPHQKWNELFFTPYSQCEGGPPYFDRSVNSISFRAGGRLCTPQYYLPPRIFWPSYSSDVVLNFASSLDSCGINFGPCSQCNVFSTSIRHNIMYWNNFLRSIHAS